MNFLQKTIRHGPLLKPRALPIPPISTLQAPRRPSPLTTPGQNILISSLQSTKGKRCIFSSVNPFLLVPTAFTLLLVAHWLHKCLLMILFQNRIIYMPSLPPGSRREKLSSYSRACHPVLWREESIKSLDGTSLTLAIGTVKTEAAQEEAKDSGMNKNQDMTERRQGETKNQGKTEARKEEVKKTRKRYIIYLQGNGSSTPPRTPLLSSILTSISSSTPSCENILIALSYRGYWTSSGRPSQNGIEKDIRALLSHIRSLPSPPNQKTEIVLWGQSIGAGIASYAAQHLSEHKPQDPSQPTSNHLHLTTLILETPFTSIKAMLAALYPDRWVPYKHLHPFLRNHWDMPSALRGIAAADATAAAETESQIPASGSCSGSHQSRLPKIILLTAARDEIVPAAMGDELETLARDLGFEVLRRDVLGALHVQASALEAERGEIVGALS